MAVTVLNLMQDFTKLDSETQKIVDDLISHSQKREVPETIRGGGIITREFTVWCGLCGEWMQDTGPSMKKAQREFIRAGWSKTRKHGWLCPEHSKKSTATEK